MHGPVLRNGPSCDGGGHNWFGFGGVISPFGGAPSADLNFSSDPSLHLDDDAILSEMMDSVHVNGNVVTMDPVTIHIVPGIADAFSLSYHSEADVTAVPDLVTLPALLIGLTGILGLRARRRAR